MYKKIDPLLLRELLDYDPNSGALTWLPRPTAMFNNEHRAKVWNSKNAGRPALASVSNTDGYRYGAIFGKSFSAHRVIWAYVYGEWPRFQIDHINHDRADNRIANLREVSIRDNSRNQSLRSDNKSGVVGVYWSKPHGKWRAHLRNGPGGNYLGLFGCFGKAIKARKLAEKNLGFHENHGKEKV